MGVVVQFGRMEMQPPAGSAVPLEEHLSAVSESGPAMRAAKETIAKALTSLMSIAENTEDPGVREHIRHHLSRIKDELLPLSFKLLEAKGQLLNALEIIDDQSSCHASGPGS